MVNLKNWMGRWLDLRSRAKQRTEKKRPWKLKNSRRACKISCKVLQLHVWVLSARNCSLANAVRRCTTANASSDQKTERLEADHNSWLILYGNKRQWSISCHLHTPAMRMKNVFLNYHADRRGMLYSKTAREVLLVLFVQKLFTLYCSKKVLQNQKVSLEFTPWTFESCGKFKLSSFTRYIKLTLLRLFGSKTNFGNIVFKRGICKSSCNDPPCSINYMFVDHTTPKTFFLKTFNKIEVFYLQWKIATGWIIKQCAYRMSTLIRRYLKEIVWTRKKS